jgi:hypothetical protein
VGIEVNFIINLIPTHNYKLLSNKASSSIAELFHQTNILAFQATF